jgi:nicotinamidase-related amidase
LLLTFEKSNKKGEKMKTHLLVIDPQNDFCDKNGALFVAGADQDAIRLGKMINRLIKKIDDIHVTLDSHRTVDIAHPIFWINSKGQHPGPFTIISEADVAGGVWMTTNPAWRQKGLDYVKSLAKNGRYPLCIWPPHCRIGTWGHSIVKNISDALLKWEEERFGVIDFVTKGSNIFTEHYSALQADVPDPADPSTSINTDLLAVLQDADVILITGEALSHCVRNSVLDIMNNFGEENIKKFVLLEDTCSNVPGFENLGKEFIQIATKRGMQLSTSVDYLA